jgi:hypothetical protein
MLWLRKIVFYIFALIYLVICPLIVARMLGFVINPLTHHIVKTGLVYISTNPPDATVYVDGRLSHQKTPAVLRDLRPGKHFIRIEMDGYNDWERDVPIVGKKATVLANTLLIPQEWPIKKISDRSYQNIFPAGQDILIATDPILKDIDIYHSSQGPGKSLFSKNSIYADGLLVRLFSAPKSPFILLEATIKDKHKFLWVNLKENPPMVEDISDLFSDIPTRIAWDNADNENIFAFYLRDVYRINIKDKAVSLQDAGRLPEGLGTQASDALSDKFLINDKNTLLVREGIQIRIYPKEDFGPSKVYDIARSKPLTNMYFEEKTGELFYLDDDTGFLYTAQILPYHPILNIPIPESLRIDIPKKESAI